MKSFLALFLLASCSLQAQIITTIAGDGTMGYSGDGGAATAAKIYHPAGVTTDPIGNVYFADFDNDRIRKIDTNGIISTFAGGGSLHTDGSPATAFYLNDPYDVICDNSGNFYIASASNRRVFKVNSAGIMTTVAGSGGWPGFSGDGGPATSAVFNNPGALAIDRMGNIYIADIYNDRIRKVDTYGIVTTVAGGGTGSLGDGGPATAAKLDWPAGVAVDTFGNIYIGDYNNLRVRKVNPAGIISTVAGGGTWSPTVLESVPATSVAIGLTGKVKVDGVGNVYYADESYHRVRVIDRFGKIHTVAGRGDVGTTGYAGDGGPATAALLYQPVGIHIVDSVGIYITDWGNNRVRRMEPGSGYSIGATTSADIVSNLIFDVNISPNPANSTLTVSSKSEIREINITNLLGQVVYTGVHHSDKVCICVADLASGCYFIKVNASQGRVFMKE